MILQEIQNPNNGNRQPANTTAYPIKLMLAVGDGMNVRKLESWNLEHGTHNSVVVLIMMLNIHSVLTLHRYHFVVVIVVCAEKRSTSSIFIVDFITSDIFIFIQHLHFHISGCLNGFCLLLTRLRNRLLLFCLSKQTYKQAK